MGKTVEHCNARGEEFEYVPRSRQSGCRVVRPKRGMFDGVSFFGEVWKSLLTSYPPSEIEMLE